MSLSRSLARGLIAPVGFILALGGGLLVGVGQDPAPADPGDPMQVRPIVTGSPAALMEEHGCWAGEAPPDMVGKIPGHVVVTVRHVTRYAGPEMTGKALEHVFEGKYPALTVHGFCR